MAKFELVMPKMGESIMEATILNWAKQPGDSVEVDETILEIATDKVDSEIPSPVKGVVSEILFNVNDVVPIGKTIALIETGANGNVSVEADVRDSKNSPEPAVVSNISHEPEPPQAQDKSDKFYSPLVRSIAKEENVSLQELDSINGSGNKGRVTKQDLLDYIEARQTSVPTASAQIRDVSPAVTHTVRQESTPAVKTPQSASYVSGDVEIIEMDRMRKLIADHMVMSKHTSPHVTSFVEADVTTIVKWREKVKPEFASKYGQSITFTPIFIDAVIKAIREFPLINSSVEGTTIIRKKNINIGMAAALPSGNLIVPVIKNADQLNLIGLARSVNDLAGRARNNQLKPEEIKDGTFTITNVGTFGNAMGTPIINQPQVAILATGSIKKKPVVLETEDGDVIAIRHMMFLSLSYDHRVVDGMLGGSFLRKVADFLESFDPGQTI